MILKSMKEFIVAENGAVTVDWVVLTAAICGLGVGVVLQLHNSTETVATAVSEAVATADIGSN